MGRLGHTLLKEFTQPLSFRSGRRPPVAIGSCRLVVLGLLRAYLSKVCSVAGHTTEQRRNKCISIVTHLPSLSR